MTEIDDKFEDFDLGDDMDDPWDDEPAGDEGDDDSKDSNAGKPKSSKVNIIKLLVVVVIIGAGLLFFAPVFMSSGKDAGIAVVKIDEAQQHTPEKLDAVNDNAINNTELNDLAAFGEENAEDANSVPSGASDSLDSGYGAILTPMPEDILEQTQAPLDDLASLSFEDAMASRDVVQENAVQENIADGGETFSDLEPQETQETTDNNLLIEDELLSKTETLFEDFVPVEVAQKNIDTVDVSNDLLDLRLESVPEDTPYVDTEKNDINFDGGIETPEDASSDGASASIDFNEIAEIKADAKQSDFVAGGISNIGVEIVETAVIEKPVIKAPVIKAIEPKKIVKETIIEEVKAKAIDKKPVIAKKKHRKPIWIIRAAQSGSAIIYDKTSKEMKSIEVNDRVKGVGRIKSIKIIDGVWVITGSSGKIEQ